MNAHGVEYWTAREIMPLLDYSEWRNFSHAIERAKTSCQQSGNVPQDHFVDVTTMIATGKGAKRKAADVQLSRFACYLIAQNGDPSKAAIAHAQKYFAIQARRQEVSDQIAADQERIEHRDRCSDEYKALSGAAKQAGVNSRKFGVFHDAGYRGLYGMGCSAIKDRKGVPQKENLLDRMGTTELAANAFRCTQARERINESAANEQQAIVINEKVGREVRDAIRRIGGTMPENLPAAEHIKETKKRLKKATPKIELEKSDAIGLVAAPPDDLSDL
ncbi:MAG: DNA damage-inducible protein D [Pirellulales bacterium]